MADCVCEAQRQPHDKLEGVCPDDDAACDFGCCTLDSVDDADEVERSILSDRDPEDGRTDY